PPEGDRVDISARAQEVQKLREAVARLPEVRRDRVERVARELGQGTYRVSPEEVAEKILGRSLVDRLV
ncbi:MAG: flagellar biosynthesis anti-sigma factor FlgM, partial [Acetobacteraceae bacterium]|nr:flagellar biosynthesis anti-sigma factor FlgM [Acetobacteraceae bacterium]